MSAPLAPAKPLGSPSRHVCWLCCHHFSPVALDSDPSGSPWGLGLNRRVCDLPPLHPRQSPRTKHAPSHFSIPLCSMSLLKCCRQRAPLSSSLPHPTLSPLSVSIANVNKALTLK